MNNNRLERLFTFQKDSPNDPFILFAIAKEYEKLQETGKALEYYQQLATNHNDYVGTYYHLGKLYEQLQQPSEAFFTYKKGMEVAKAAGDQHALSELAGAKLMLGDDEDFE
ncbi:MAG: tetratricopeptide repeat protein [Saprospiraceae bacterium]